MDGPGESEADPGSAGPGRSGVDSPAISALPNYPEDPARPAGKAAQGPPVGGGDGTPHPVHDVSSESGVAPATRHESGQGALRRGVERPQFPLLDPPAALDGLARALPRVPSPI